MGATSFTVDEVTYTLSSTLTVERARILQRFEIEFSVDTNLPGIVGLVDNIWSLKNAGKDADATHALGGLRDMFSLDGANILGKNRLRAVEICSLWFIGNNGEDPGTYDFNYQHEKCYSHWKKVDARFFFIRAVELLVSWQQSLLQPGPPESATASGEQ